MWCVKYKHWSMTHRTSIHKGPPFSETKTSTPKNDTKSENLCILAELVAENTNPCNLEISAWCGYTTEPTNTTTTQDFNLGTWIPVISCNSKKKKHTSTWNICQSLFLLTPQENYSICHRCTPDTIAIQILNNISYKYNSGSYYTDPVTGEGIWILDTNKAIGL